jgi:hypothetical protein
MPASPVSPIKPATPDSPTQPKPSGPPVEKYCAVCGQGSTRADWQDKDSPVCDFHTPEEVKTAASEKKPDQTPAKPVETPPSDKPPVETSEPSPNPPSRPSRH